MQENINLTENIPESLAGKRLDQALAEIFPDYSRARLQEWIKTGQITVDNKILKPKDKVNGGELVKINAVLKATEDWIPQEIDLDIVYEDEDIIIVNKPARLVVHPAAGNRDGTLVNALLNHVPELELLPRAGLIHRLDKDTTGLLVVARNLVAHNKLVEELQERRFKREYEAIVHGVMTGGGTIDAPIGRHPHNRIKMAVIDSGKPAKTHYRVIQRFAKCTHIKVMLETGRTHQIRVHMAHIHYPIVGDKVYAGRYKTPQFPRQALHAKLLGLTHPASGEYVEWHVALPDDMQNLLNSL